MKFQVITIWWLCELKNKAYRRHLEIQFTDTLLWLSVRIVIKTNKQTNKQKKQMCSKADLMKEQGEVQNYSLIQSAGLKIHSPDQQPQ